MTTPILPPYEPRDPRTVLRAHDLWAKKHFGQNFLVSAGAPERIAAAGGATPEDVAFEIGAGCGTLTRAIAARGCRVIALEHDRDLVPVARAEVIPWPRAEVREGNVLDADWSALSAEVGRPLLLYGNLPYHLSTPILLSLLENPRSWDRACFLLQREFAERVAAPPGTRECGTLSAYAALLTEPRIAFRLPPGAFHPPRRSSRPFWCSCAGPRPRPMWATSRSSAGWCARSSRSAARPPETPCERRRRTPRARCPTPGSPPIGVARRSPCLSSPR